jgi:hypothetical protein
MTAWDPIGVGDVAEAWDEYDSYIGDVALRLREAADDDDVAQSVAAYLQHLARDFMGLAAGPSARADDLAAALVAWHEWSFLRGGRPPQEWIDDA